MKNVILFLTISLFTNNVSAQTADEIITNYFNMSGGVENWQALKGMRVETVVNDQGMAIPSTKIYLKDGRVIIKFTLDKKEMVQVAFDGKVAWGDDFMTMEPKKSSEELIENMKREANDFPVPLLNYQQNGYTVKLIGHDTIANQLCYKIELTKNKQLINGQEMDDIEFYYFSTADNNLLAVESVIQAGQLKGKLRRDIYSKFNTVEGLLFPFVINREIENNGSMVINIESIELNPIVDESIFILPAKK